MSRSFGGGILILCSVLALRNCGPGIPATTLVKPSQVPTPRTTVIDPGVLYDDPCALPCWEGITPGSSTEEDVVNILERLKKEGKIESYSSHSRTSSQQSYLAIPSGPGGGSIDIFFADDGYVSYFTLGYLGTFDFRMKRAIERFGIPEAIVPPRALKQFGTPAPCSCENWDDQLYNVAPGFNAILLYPSRGMSIGILIPPMYGGCLCPEMLTPGFSFYRATTLEEALNAARTPVFFNSDFSAEDLVPWHGYGDGY